MTAPIRVLLADDHPIFRRGLRSLLAEYDDLQVVGETDNSPTTLEQVTVQRPDVLLLDVRMGGANGIEIARELRRTASDVRVIILTTYDNDEYLFGALQVGAHAYLLKDVALDNLPAAIRAVHQGERLLSPQLVDRVLHQFQALASEKLRQESGLSPEELRILELIAEGATNQSIAKQFFWREITIKKKVQDILVKLGAANRAQAVATAIRRGLI
jgi:DNA-binding NarL/FixJ family response regulator